MKGESGILRRVRKMQKDLELFYLLRVLPEVFTKAVRQTAHFKKWFAAPMSYVRMIELPLTILLMDLKSEFRLMDISSPKLLSLYLGTNGFSDIVISDSEEYFVEDFEIYAREFRFSPQIETFDATSMPFDDNSFDRVFSVSVLEHVPDRGDIDIAREVSRVLRPGGIFVITCPAGRAYDEEWLEKKDFYWPTKIREDGYAFFQRRYDEQSIHGRFGNIGFEIEDVVFIAEEPIEEPRLSDNGRFLYNVYYLEELGWVRMLKRLHNRFRLPLLPYLAYRYLSSRYHYLTRDGNDKNIRQAAVKLRRWRQ